jgi:hypothetical protein
VFSEGKEGELLGRLQKKLGKSKDEGPADDREIVTANEGLRRGSAKPHHYENQIRHRPGRRTCAKNA